MLSTLEKARRSYNSNRSAIVRSCNEMLKRIRNESNVPGIIFEFSSCDSSSALNSLLKAKEYVASRRPEIIDISNTCFRPLPHLSIEFAEREMV